MSVCSVSDAQMIEACGLLERFVEIPSMSNPDSPGYNMNHLKEAATFAHGELDRLGFDTREVSIEGSAPFVIAKRIVDAKLPTILIYGHYDVQPVDDKKWASDPFVVKERDGRLYGRGTSDDKGGIVAVLTALGALLETYGELPVNITVLLEGEEEHGSGHMRELLRQEKESLKADALVVMDGVNRDKETGTLTNATRGLVDIGIEVNALEDPVHSGDGVLVPDPAQDLTALVYSLRNPKLIPGFLDDCEPLSSFERETLKKDSQTAEEYAHKTKVKKGGVLRGNPEDSISARIVEEPSLSVVNMVCGQHSGGNSIQDKATATVGIRIVAGQDPDRVSRVVIEYLQSQIQELRRLGEIKSAEVKIKNLEGCWAWKANLDGPLSRAYMEALQEIFPKICAQPTGGALPLLHEFNEVFPDMEMIVPGVEDPPCAAHGHNESQDIGLWRRAMDALIVFLQKARNIVRRS